MKLNSQFILGLIVGLALGAFLFRSEKVQKKDNIVANETLIEELPSDSQKIVKTRNIEVKKELEKTEIVVSQEKIHKHDERTENIKIPQKIEVMLSAGDILQIENKWDELQNEIQVVNESRGWRVVHLQEGTVLYNAGLRSGSLITYEFPKMLGDETNDSTLASRVARILNHVSIK